MINTIELLYNVLLTVLRAIAAVLFVLRARETYYVLRKRT